MGVFTDLFKALMSKLADNALPEGIEAKHNDNYRDDDAYSGGSFSAANGVYKFSVQQDKEAIDKIREETVAFEEGLKFSPGKIVESYNSFKNVYDKHKSNFILTPRDMSLMDGLKKQLKAIIEQEPQPYEFQQQYLCRDDDGRAAVVTGTKRADGTLYALCASEKYLMKVSRMPNGDYSISKEANDPLKEGSSIVHTETMRGGVLSSSTVRISKNGPEKDLIGKLNQMLNPNEVKEMDGEKAEEDGKYVIDNIVTRKVDGKLEANGLRYEYLDQTMKDVQDPDKIEVYTVDSDGNQKVTVYEKQPDGKYQVMDDKGEPEKDVPEMEFEELKDKIAEEKEVTITEDMLKTQREMAKNDKVKNVTPFEQFIDFAITGKFPEKINEALAQGIDNDKANQLLDEEEKEEEAKKAKEAEDVKENGAR